MIQQPNKLEMGIIKLLLHRIESKSPKLYASIVAICTWGASIMGLYVVAYTTTPIIPHASYWAIAENIFIVLGAAFTSAGIVAATNTKDPTLITDDVKKAILEQAVQDGTHKPVDTSDRGNDTNG